MGVDWLLGLLLGLIAYILARCIIGGLYTVEQNERAVVTSFGKAERIGTLTTLDDPLSETLPPEDRERYIYPQVAVVGPGGPYFKWPWQKVRKVSVAIETISIAFDPQSPMANNGGSVLEAVTKDQLNIGITGQLRFYISERNLYAYLFGVKNPVAHIMGYFVSILRERIANFAAKRADDLVNLPPSADGTPVADDGIRFEGISINDLRKNLNDLNLRMDSECASSAARYGIVLEASLITGMDPPPQVDSALAAINTANNEVSADISSAQAQADQRIVESKKAVEIQTMKAQAEVEPLRWLSEQLRQLKASGSDAIPGYLRNVRLDLYRQARHIILDLKK
ncbi:MAG: SPFH domain-containing protein [Candidatus Methylacidiphilales bacterium]|nr:SPFH domain-containing protein [Candidatus Methylacidiphilales bacterium]